MNLLFIITGSIAAKKCLKILNSLQEIFLDKINEIGFLNSSYVDLFDGIVSIHKGYKV